MKTTMKTGLLLVSAALASFALVGCDGDDDNGTTDGGGKTDSSTTTDGGGKTDSSTTTDGGNTDGGNTDGGKTDGGDGGVTLPTGQIDRMGRPAINTALINKPNKDPYNRHPTYDNNVPAFVAPNFNANLIGLDSLANGNDWGTPDGGTHALVGALGGSPVANTGEFYDVLIVDTSKPCGAQGRGSYLDIELFVLGLRGTANTTCGGRTIDDDVIDTTLSALVTGLAAPVSDGVNAAPADAQATAAWPYVRPTN